VDWLNSPFAEIIKQPPNSEIFTIGEKIPHKSVLCWVFIL
jgi:hypothetical protein